MIPFRSLGLPKGRAPTSSSPIRITASWIVASGSMNSTWRVMKSATFMASVLSFILPTELLIEGPDHRDEGKTGRDDQGRQRQAQLAIVAKAVAAGSHDQRVA